MPTEPNILIKTALNHAVQLINNGDNPTDALKKTADEYDLNYDYTHRVGEGLNVALHLNHFETSMDKAAEFPLADIPGVVENMYKVNEKTAAHDLAEQFPNPELYSNLPDFNQIYTNSLAKEAYVKIASTKLEPMHKLSYEETYRRSADFVRTLEKIAEEKQAEMVETKNSMTASFFHLANHFKKAAESRLPFEEFESQAFAKHGKSVIPYLDVMYKHANLKEERGVHDVGYKMHDDSYELGKLGEFLELVEKFPVTAKEANEAKEAYLEKDILMEVIKCASYAFKLDGSEKVEKVAGGFLDELMGLAKDKITKDDKGKGGPTPGHNRMEAMERQMVLQDILMRDPILSKENPKLVINCYETLMRLAPRLATEKNVVISILRKMTASGNTLSPFDSSSIMDAESSLLKNRSLTHGMNVGGGK